VLRAIETDPVIWLKLALKVVLPIILIYPFLKILIMKLFVGYVVGGEE
jgi:hypothetical protein